jgi:hypothetical protein
LGVLSDASERRHTASVLACVHARCVGSEANVDKSREQAFRPVNGGELGERHDKCDDKRQNKLRNIGGCCRRTCRESDSARTELSFLEESRAMMLGKTLLTKSFLGKFLLTKIVARAIHFSSQCQHNFSRACVFSTLADMPSTNNIRRRIRRGGVVYGGQR